jgi:hypothetical protein
MVKPVIPKEILIKYFKDLIHRVYKCIPVLEGRDFSGRVVYLENISKENFQKYLSKLILEIYGNSDLFFLNEKPVRILGILEGTIKEDPDNFAKIRSNIFDCTSILEKIIKDLEKEEG